MKTIQRENDRGSIIAEVPERRTTGLLVTGLIVIQVTVFKTEWINVRSSTC